MTRTERRADFQDILPIMSHDAVLDYAEGAIGSRHQRIAAINELRHRVRKGEVDDIPFHRAAKVLNLA